MKRLSSIHVLVAYLVIAIAVIGCTYTTIVDEPPPEDPVYVEPSPRFVELEATLKSIQDSLFITTCTFSQCHNTSSMAARLDLGRGLSYSNLVNIPSLQDSTILRVHPGKPDSSYLIWKMEGHPDMRGRLMPICASGVQCLDSRVIDKVREWIVNGALEVDAG